VSTADARTLQKDDEMWWETRNITGMVKAITDHSVIVLWEGGYVGVHSFNNMDNIHQVKREGKNAQPIMCG
jgi:ribosomal protein S1